MTRHLKLNSDEKQNEGTKEKEIILMLRKVIIRDQNRGKKASDLICCVSHMKRVDVQFENKTRLQKITFSYKVGII